VIPPKNRDRKCSTCRHYQPSPLWRKGWCRNPLLYDRNTNHLVEADSLACNRTFIDYWEPIVGAQPPVGPQPRAGKPRIAPSIPMTTTDPKGQRGITTGNTPAAGMAALNARPPAVPDGGRDVPKLALVTPDYDPMAPEVAPYVGPVEATKATRQIEQAEGPAAPPPPMTAAQRIRKARQEGRADWLRSNRNRLMLGLAALVVVAAIGGGAFLMRKGSQPGVIAPLPTAAATKPLPTPTGFGDATATPVATATSAHPAPAANVIGVNGWVQVQADSLIVRQGPTKSASRVTSIANGTKAHVIGGPTDADGLTWWQIDNFDPKNTSKSGWCAGKYLTPIPAP
jgi:hypothetical protein